MTPPRLVAIDEAVIGIANVPRSYLILGDSPPLAGMPHPQSDKVWEALSSAGFSDVVCLTDESTLYDPAPLAFHSFPLEDLWGGHDPSDPVGEANVVRNAVAEVLQLISERRGVVVHCVGGRGRTGTVVGAALVVLGHAPITVVQWLDELHRRRQRDGWPESDWQAQLLEEFSS